MVLVKFDSTLTYSVDSTKLSCSVIESSDGTFDNYLIDSIIVAIRSVYDYSLPQVNLIFNKKVIFDSS